MMVPPRVDVTPDQIDRVVAAFYAAVRADAVLGPVFAAHVHDWPPHEAKIGRFWRNALLGDGGYSGNPMQVHRGAAGLKPEHFAHWLTIFDGVLVQVLPDGPAKGWSVIAHRIGRGLRLGLAPVTGIPNLRD